MIAAEDMVIVMGVIPEIDKRSLHVKIATEIRTTPETTIVATAMGWVAHLGIDRNQHHAEIAMEIETNTLEKVILLPKERMKAPTGVAGMEISMTVAGMEISMTE